MRILNLMLTVFLLTGVASAQTPSSVPDAPGVTVISKKWRKQLRPNALNDTQVSDHQKQLEYERDMKDTLYENTVRAKAGERPLRLPTPPGLSRSEPGAKRYRNPGQYVYEVKIRNTGTKKIRELTWEYVLFDPNTGREVGSHRFTNEESISPGKTKTMTGYSVTSPVSVVDVTKSGKEEVGQYSERVVIHSIEYDDGSSWQRPSN
jgi:hypothetical protein